MQEQYADTLTGIDTSGVISEEAEQTIKTALEEYKKQVSVEWQA